MPWQQLSLEAGDLNAEELATFFESRGALSVTFVDAADQPLFEPDPGTTPLWSATLVTALFDADAELGPLKQQLAETYGAAVLHRLIEETLHDRDWERAWLDQFHPMQFGERLWICPDGQRPPPKDDQVLIDLDPGLAFGTGTHPTTALCLTWLDQHPPVGAHQEVPVEIAFLGESAQLHGLSVPDRQGCRCLGELDPLLIGTGKAAQLRCDLQ